MGLLEQPQILGGGAQCTSLLVCMFHLCYLNKRLTYKFSELKFLSFVFDDVMMVENNGPIEIFKIVLLLIENVNNFKLLEFSYV